MQCNYVLTYLVGVQLQVLFTLGSEHRPSQAAQCVASIACAELPHNLWQDLMSTLVLNVTAENSTEMMKESSLEAIGYICQDIVRLYQSCPSALRFGPVNVYLLW